MQKVEGSNPFIRSISPQAGSGPSRPPFCWAPWPSGLGTGLQNPIHRFDSGRRLLRLMCTIFPALSLIIAPSRRFRAVAWQENTARVEMSIETALLSASRARRDQ